MGNDMNVRCIYTLARLYVPRCVSHAVFEDILLVAYIARDVSGMKFV